MADTNPFWEFSLELYGKAGVAPACLELQDNSGVDVNLLLFCCWRASEACELGRQELETLAAASSSWREEVLLPIRDLRVRLRGRSGVEGCRDYLKQAELEAERLQQQIIYSEFPSLEPGVTEVAGALAHNLGELAEFYGLPIEVLDGIRSAVEAAIRGLKSAPSAG